MHPLDCNHSENPYFACAPLQSSQTCTHHPLQQQHFFFFAGKILFFPTLCASVSENEYWLSHGVIHLHSVNIIIKMSLQTKQTNKNQKREGGENVWLFHMIKLLGTWMFSVVNSGEQPLALTRTCI